MSDSKVHRRWIGGANAVVIAVVAVAIAVLLNALFSQVFWRVDMTDNQIYTLSEVSQRAVQDLDEPIEVRAFISPNLPPPYHGLDRQIEELLMEYRAASDGMLNYRIIAPEDDEAVEELARGYGVERVTIGEETARSRSYREVYKGLAFIRGDRVEAISDLRSSGRPELDSYEYEFTRALMNVVDPEPRRVAVLTGAGGQAHHRQAVESLQSVFEQMYGELLRVEPLDLQEQPEIPEHYEAVVIWNIDRDLGDKALEAIDRFVAQGGNLGWFQSGGVIDEQRSREARAALRTPLNSDLVEYMRRQGIHFGRDAVIDRQRALAYGAVPTEDGLVRVSHPALFPVTDMAHELAPMRHFSALVIPLPSTVNVERSRIGTEAEVLEVLRTDETSVRLPEPPGVALYEELIQPVYGEEEGSFVIAVAVQGTLPVHRQIGGDTESASSRLFVVGSGDFMGSYPELGYHGELSGLGLEFFLSSVEWLAQHDELAQVRGKSRPTLVADVPAEARQLMQFMNIAIVPAFFACIALFMWVRRMRRKRELMPDRDITNEVECE